MATTTLPPRSILPAVWDVPSRFRERLGERVGRQRAMGHEGHLLLVLHAPPGPDDEERTGRFFWRKPDGTWASDALGGGINALNRHLAEFDELLDVLERQNVAAQSSEDYFRALNSIAPLHRTICHLHQALQQARELVPEDRNLINVRDRAYELERTAELLHTDIKNALDYAVARRSEELARSGHRMAVSAHRLNLLAAFFFPIATLCAVFGVNLQHGLETTSFDPLPFLGVLAIGLVFGAVLALFIARPSDRGT